MLKPQPGKKQKVCGIGIPAVDETEELGLKLKDAQAFWKKLLKNAGSPVVWDELEVCILTNPEHYIQNLI